MNKVISVDLEKWMVNGFYGIHGLMHKRALNPEAGPLSEDDMKSLRKVAEKLEKIIKEIKTTKEPEANDNLDWEMIRLYHLLCDMIMYHRPNNRMSVKVMESLKQELVIINKIIKGYETLNERHQNQIKTK